VNNRVVAAAGPGCAGALAVLYASLGAGWPPRRSAIAFMMGSWGARLAVQLLFTPTTDAGVPSSRIGLVPFALFFSVPALFASLNPEEGFSSAELVASAIWLIGFAAETTADRQRLRFVARPENAGLPCRSGLWRYVPQAHATFEMSMWLAYALFSSASPWGWLAFACPVTMLYLQVRHRY
jgi:steroid 5-alpha reductase family enzyme